jgi:serine/threonine-protein kinase
MDPARWARAQALFHDALERPPASRPAWLAAACGDDTALHDEVRALLAADEGGAGPLDGPVAHVARALLAGADAPLPDVAFGPYRLVEVLGEGGMGVVYLAQRADLGSRAAIKILRDAWLSPARRARFAAEQRTLAHLHHPAIAQLYDADTLPDGTPWFAMQYVEGEPLTTWCRARDCGLEERLRLFRDVCGAVQHAHAQAVIHRDLKPSNILVTAEGRVMLLDFGIAKHLEHADVEADQTRTGLRLMTPAYAAPEQVRGERAGVQADVYSLGVVLYELLAGRLPYDLAHRTPAEALQVVGAHEPVRPSAVARAVAGRGDRAGAQRAGARAWADLDVLCLTAMHVDRARRYATVEALARDVDRFLRGEPLEARGDSAGYRFTKFVARHRGAVAAGALAVAALVGVIAFYTWRLAAARDAALAGAARAERIQRFTIGLFQGGDEAAGPAESLRVVTLLDRGVEQAAALEREPAARAELLQTLGGLFQSMGRLDRADSLLTGALALRLAAASGPDAEVARGAVAVGLLRAEQARLDEAEAIARTALELAAASRPDGHPDRAAALAALGHVLRERGAYDSAIAVLGRAVALHARDGDSPGLEAARAELANAHFFAGHHDVADSINALVLDAARARHGARHPMVAELLVNLGAAQFDRGRYAEAERLFREALEITAAWHGPDHPQLASRLTMLGQALVYQSRYAEADAMLRQALAIRERAYGPAHPAVASTLNEIGNLALREKRLDDAEAAFARMVAIYREAYGGTHYLVGTASSNLATVHMERRELAAAEALYREAVRQFEATQGPGHLNSGIAHIKLGRALLRQGRFAEAAPESRRGYDVLVPQVEPGISFLRAARRDLIAAYDSLGRADLAAPFRAEVADTASGR